MNQQLLDYIKKRLSTAISQAEITNELKSQGWTDEDIAQVFQYLAQQVQVQEPAELQQISQPAESQHPKKRAKLFIVIAGIGIIILVAVAGFFVLVKQPTTQPLQQPTAQPPWVALTPVQLDLSHEEIANAEQYTQNGISFRVPWQDEPKVFTQADTTQLKFANGKVITTFDFTHMDDFDFANELARNVQALEGKFEQGKLTELKNEVLGLTTDHDFYMWLLNITPSSDGLRSLYLPNKSSLVLDAQLIYYFSLPTMMVIGYTYHSDSIDGQVWRNYVFDNKGKYVRKVTIGKATENEAKFILSSFEMVQ